MNKNNNRENKLYTIREVSELSGVSEPEIIRLIHLKKLRAIRTGKKIRITEKEFEDFLNYMIDHTVTGKNSVMAYNNGDDTVLYTAEQVARILQLSVDNIWLLLKSGELKGFKIRGGRSSWRITAKNLKDFIEMRSKLYAR